MFKKRAKKGIFLGTSWKVATKKILFSIDLVYTGICELDIWKCFEGEQLSFKLCLSYSVAETMNSLSVTNSCQC